MNKSYGLRLLLLHNFKPVIILDPWGRRRPGLCTDIPVPVLQVPAGEEGGPGQKKLIMLFWPILDHFWCSVVTLVNFSITL